MSDRITLTGIRAYGYHGVLESEARDGQEFIIDIDLSVDFAAAARTDDLTATVDYGAVARLVVETVASTRFNLIEALSDEIARRILDLHAPVAVTVTVHKPHAPIDVPFTDVSVTRQLP